MKSKTHLCISSVCLAATAVWNTAVKLEEDAGGTEVMRWREERERGERRGGERGDGGEGGEGERE